MFDGDRIRLEMKEIFKSALQRIDPRRMIMSRVQRTGGKIDIAGESFELSEVDRIFVLAIGKAAYPLVKGLDDCLGDLIDSGVVLSNAFFGTLPDKYKSYQCSHPLPGADNVRAAGKLLKLAESAAEKDLVICLVSGGGSSILSYPAPGISVAEKSDAVSVLMLAGAAIDELNVVRKHLSMVKGGKLLQAIAPATTLGLYLSDVPGDDLQVIASGPTVPDKSTFSDAYSVLQRYEVEDKIPQSIIRHIERGIAGEIEETLKPGSTLSANWTNLIIGRNLDMLLALEEEFRIRGYWTMVDPEHFQGEAVEFSKEFVNKALRLAGNLSAEERPYTLIRGGETTVTVQGNGLGGRNTELALAAAKELEGNAECIVLAAGTDGVDGPTDAAGAVVDGSTVARGLEAGLRAEDYLRNNDSYNFFAPLGDLIITGPTGTNLMDVAIAVVGRSQSQG